MCISYTEIIFLEGSPNMFFLAAPLLFNSRRFTMAHTVTVKQIREVNNSKKLVAYVDVIINGTMKIQNFKILRIEQNTFWVANPQTEAKEKFYEMMLEFLDMELEQEVKGTILSSYLKMLQSRNVAPEVTE